MARRGTTTPRPISHDLMVALLGAAGSRVERVVIERLEENTFFATVTVVSNGEPHEVDARPSDALNIALRAGAPIHVAHDVVDKAGVPGWPGPPDPASDQPPWTSASARFASARATNYAIDEHSPPMLQRAATEARELGHNTVGRTLLMLGILADERCPAARLLRQHGITADALRAKLGPAATGHVVAPDAAMPITVHAQFALTGASTLARRRGTLDIAPLHVLLALVIPPDAADALGLSRDQVETLREDARAALDTPDP